jgi:hypothetical protein
VSRLDDARAAWQEAEHLLDRGRLGASGAWIEAAEAWRDVCRERFLQMAAEIERGDRPHRRSTEANRGAS